MKSFNSPSVHVSVDGMARCEAQVNSAECSIVKETDFNMEEDWNNSKRDSEYGNRPRRRDRNSNGYESRADDSSINLRVTVVADNGNMCVFHKIMANGEAKPTGIPANRIATIGVSQMNGSTLVITSEGTVCIQETFEEAMKIYSAARPIVLSASDN